MDGGGAVVGKARGRAARQEEGEKLEQGNQWKKGEGEQQDERRAKSWNRGRSSGKRERVSNKTGGGREAGTGEEVVEKGRGRAARQEEGEKGLEEEEQ